MSIAAGCTWVLGGSWLRGPVLVVVSLVGGEHVSRVRFSHDEDVVEDFAPDAADDALAVGVHPRGPRCTLDHVQILGFEERVECLAVLAVSIAQQEPQGLRSHAEVGGEIPRLLDGPVPGRVAGHPSDVQAPRAVFEEGQRVQPSAECGVDVEEVCSDDAFGLGGEELVPGWAGAVRGRGDARSVDDLPYRRGGDLVPEPRQLALDPPVAPPRILAGESKHEVFDCRSSGWPTGAPARAVVPLRSDESAMPAEQGTRGDREEFAPEESRYPTGQGCEPEPVRWLVADWTGQLSAQHRIFVP